MEEKRDVSEERQGQNENETGNGTWNSERVGRSTRQVGEFKPTNNVRIVMRAVLILGGMKGLVRAEYSKKFRQNKKTGKGGK